MLTFTVHQSVQKKKKEVNTNKHTCAQFILLENCRDLSDPAVSTSWKHKTIRSIW